MLINGRLSIVRGGGDIATGIIYRLWRCGFKVLALETRAPLVVRRAVSAASAIFSGACVIEGMPIKRVFSAEEAFECKDVSVLVDPEGNSIKILKLGLLVDAIMAKVNLGTTIYMAPLVIGVGPGFTATLTFIMLSKPKEGIP